MFWTFSVEGTGRNKTEERALEFESDSLRLAPAQPLDLCYEQSTATQTAVSIT